LEKENAKFDSLKMVGWIREGLLVINGEITATMILLINKPDHMVKWILLGILSISLYLLAIKVMDATLDLLQPISVALRGLIKEIRTKTEKLTTIAGNIDNKKSF
jgi:hypothetical protein